MVSASAIVEKFAGAYLFQIAQKESFDYLLILFVQFNFNFLHSVSTFCTQFQGSKDDAVVKVLASRPQCGSRVRFRPGAICGLSLLLALALLRGFSSGTPVFLPHIILPQIPTLPG